MTRLMSYQGESLILPSESVLILKKHLRQLGWHYRIRIKSNFLLLYSGKCPWLVVFFLDLGNRFLWGRVF
ncbi:hypothetical protein J7M22_03710, partial [Candidatus Poribacteria bacterium]|nr:hypothetical protein [Candidatus Poribacteria bacterium]